MSASRKIIITLHLEHYSIISMSFLTKANLNSLNNLLSLTKLTIESKSKKIYLNPCFF